MKSTCISKFRRLFRTRIILAILFGCLGVSCKLIKDQMIRALLHRSSRRNPCPRVRRPKSVQTRLLRTILSTLDSRRRKARVGRSGERIPLQQLLQPSVLEHHPLLQRQRQLVEASLLEHQPLLQRQQQLFKVALFMVEHLETLGVDNLHSGTTSVHFFFEKAKKRRSPAWHEHSLNQ